MLTRRVRLRTKSRPGWAAARALVMERSTGRCEVVLPHVKDGPPAYRCGSRATEVHHILPRSAFGSRSRNRADRSGNLAAVCRYHHELASAPYRTGRLVFSRLWLTGALMEFSPPVWECRIEKGKDKFSVRARNGGSAA